VCPFLKTRITLFDNQMLAQCIHFGFRIGEISCPTRCSDEASSINFRRSVKYGFGVLATTVALFLQRARLLRFAVFNPSGKKLDQHYYETLNPGRRTGEQSCRSWAASLCLESRSQRGI
jgi:hypothetical protein